MTETEFVSISEDLDVDELSEPGMENSYMNNELNLIESQCQQFYDAIKESNDHLFVFKCHKPLNNTWCLWDKVFHIIAVIKCEELIVSDGLLIITIDENKYSYFIKESKYLTSQDTTILPNNISIYGDEFRLVSCEMDEGSC